MPLEAEGGEYKARGNGPTSGKGEGGW